MWKKVLREYFAFPKKERRGIVVLFFIWLSMIIYSSYHQRIIRLNEPFLEYNIVVSEELKKYDDQQLSSIKNHSYQQDRIFPQYFKYITYTQLIQYGMDSLQALYVLRCRDSGLSIYTKADVYKSNLDTSIKNKLTAHLKFFPEKKYFNSSYSELQKNIRIDLNAADTNAIDAIKGISKGLSKRIFKYREKLGGFKSTEQLKEVLGMDSLSFEILNRNIDLNTSVRKININTADLKSLASHPYIGYSIGKLIVNYREQHGKYSKIEDLYQIHVMNADIFSKIESYITTQDD